MQVAHRKHQTVGSVICVYCSKQVVATTARMMLTVTLDSVFRPVVVVGEEIRSETLAVPVTAQTTTATAFIKIINFNASAVYSTRRLLTARI